MGDLSQMDIHKISSSIYNTDTLKGLKLAVLDDLLFAQSRLLNFAFCRAIPIWLTIIVGS